MRYLNFFALLSVFLFFSEKSFTQSPKATGNEVLIQGFNWESWMLSDGWYNFIATKAADLGESGIDAVWLPPPSNSHYDAAQGYLPRELNNLNSAYGSEDELIALISALHNNNVKAIADIVINHRVGSSDWADFTNPTWDCSAVVIDDEWTGACGGNETGAGYAAARDLDHNNTIVRNDIKNWLLMLKNDIGFDGWRYDYVKGYAGSFIQEYDNYTDPWFVVGECWEDYNTIVNWLNSSGYDTKAFDFGLKGALHSAFNDNNLSYLNAYGNMPSISGTHPSRSVTFLENHDTGYPQNHWPFPSDKVLQGYAYILTHPGTPMVFWNHYYEWGIHDEIKTMIQIRKANGINSTSSLNIIVSDPNLYAAIIDDQVAMKIGSGSWAPTGSEWNLAASGTDYAIWSKGNVEAPILTISPASGHFNDPVDVIISAVDNDDASPTIYYTTDGTTPTTSSASAEISVTINITENTVVKAFAVDDSGNESSVISKTYTIGDVDGFYVHFKKPANWGTPNIYYWNVEPAGAMLDNTWPGVEMTPQGDDWYYFYFPNVISTNIIFNDGTNQTDDLFADTESWYDLGWVAQQDLAPMLTFNPPGSAYSNPVTVTISAVDESGQPTTIYYTTDGTTPTLSSNSATDYFSVNISETTTLNVFAVDQTGNQTPILTEEYTFVSGGFTVHFKKPDDWTNALIYYWETLPDNIMAEATWPGFNMIAEGNGWYYFDFPGVTSTNLIFNNGLSGTGNQTDDLFADDDLWYDDGNYYHAPVASDLTISGNLMQNSILSVVYNYQHPDGTPEGSTTFKWFYADDEFGTNMQNILTATSSNYLLTAFDINKYLAFSVTPVDANGIIGQEVLSDFYGPIEQYVYLLTTDNYLKFYPNPASDFVNIITDYDYQLKITDVTGKSVYLANFISGTNFVDLSTLKSGVYILNIQSEEFLISEKLIIK
ncbi:MAG: starch-binding protein [Bacteroidales bacterium]|nr:starch-binding protein [Bacteroidales bacterium]